MSEIPVRIPYSRNIRVVQESPAPDARPARGAGAAAAARAAPRQGLRHPHHGGGRRHGEHHDILTEVPITNSMHSCLDAAQRGICRGIYFSVFFAANKFLPFCAKCLIKGSTCI